MLPREIAIRIDLEIANAFLSLLEISKSPPTFRAAGGGGGAEGEVNVRIVST